MPDQTSTYPANLYEQRIAQLEENLRRDQAELRRLRKAFGAIAHELEVRAGRIKGLPGDRIKRSAYAQCARIVRELRDAGLSQ